MKEHIFYECGFCGAVYDNEKECLQCEENHAKSGHVVALQISLEAASGNPENPESLEKVEKAGYKSCSGVREWIPSTGMTIPVYTTVLSENGKVTLQKERETVFPTCKRHIDNSRIASKLAEHVFRLSNKAEEYMCLLALDAKLHPIGACEVAHGAMSQVAISPREVFVRACLLGASQVILLHNHPSGDTTPSQDDIAVTKKMLEAGKLLNIILDDHIIVGGSGSFLGIREQMPDIF